MQKRVSVHSIRKGICVVAIMLVVAGCGGGGGGTGGMAPVVYKGNENQARLTAENADVYVRKVYGSGDYAEALSITQKSRNASASFTGHVSGPLAAAVSLARSSELKLRTMKPSSADESGSSGRRAISETHPCHDGGEVALSGSISDLNLGAIRMDFRSCKMGSLSYNGDITWESKEFNSSYDTPTDVTYTFGALRFSISASSMDFTISGTLGQKINISADSETLVFNADVLDNITGKYFRFTDMSTVNVYDDIFYPTKYSSDVGGRLYDSVEGYVDIATTNSLVFSSALQNFPDSGGPMVLSGAERTWTRVIPQSSSRLILEADTNGDSVYDTYVVQDWSQSGVQGGRETNIAPVVY